MQEGPPWSMTGTLLGRGGLSPHYEDEADRRSAAKLLSKDEARRITANGAKLPEPLHKD